MNPAESNLFAHSTANPYHLSVGAVLLNDDNLVVCHHFDEIAGLNDIFVLMRETVEPGEKLEDAVRRGLREEFGARGRIERYLGSLVTYFKLNDDVEVQKTTLYFEVRQIGELEARRPDDPEAGSELTFLAPEKLAEFMRLQALRHAHRTDLNEADILERL